MFKVNVDKIENAASWDILAKDEDINVETNDDMTGKRPSSDVTNLWSSFRDSHAQVQQKVYYIYLFCFFCQQLY